ncbi:MAG TPA: uridine kinase [Candidatus Saccharimonadales bacterium]|nr:uridine kinase [Candidatus Saccharimonadales bacterium]
MAAVLPFEKRGILIGIAGGSGSGKTLVAQKIYDELGSDQVVILKQDFYYKDLSEIPTGERDVRNFDHPDAFDMDLLRSQVRNLLMGGSADVPVYDYITHLRTPATRRVGPHTIVVLEGILVLIDPELRSWMDIRCFIDTDADVRLLRRLKRDILERGRSVESVLHQYELTVRPMHLQFIEPSKRYADVIIPEGGFNLVAIDLLKTKITSILAGHRHPQEA